jgi:DNA polymerase III sliding clamp (beta) subunit (PCNA family)
MAETPVSEAKIEAAPTPPETMPPAPLTRFRAVIQGSSKRSNAVFTTNDLRGLVEVAATFGNKTAFLVDADGIKVRMLDDAKIALLDAVLPRSVFVSFDTDGKGYVVVDTKSLLTILRRAKNKEVELKFENGILTVTIAGVRSFRVRTIDSAGEEVPQPKVNHKVSAYVDIETLREALIDARVIKADAVRLVALNGALTCKAVNETKEVEAKLGPAEGEAASTYALDYLVKAAKAFGDGVVEVKFGNNTPLELTTTFNEGYVKVFIAPRVE